MPATRALSKRQVESHAPTCRCSSSRLLLRSLTRIEVHLGYRSPAGGYRSPPGSREPEHGRPGRGRCHGDALLRTALPPRFFR